MLSVVNTTKCAASFRQVSQNAEGDSGSDDEFNISVVSEKRGKKKNVHSEFKKGDPVWFSCRRKSHLTM